jgi:hypothetical protein
MNWDKLEQQARKALAKNAEQIEQSKRGIAANKSMPKRKRSRSKRFGAGYGSAT